MFRKFNKIGKRLGIQQRDAKGFGLADKIENTANTLPAEFFQERILSMRRICFYVLVYERDRVQRSRGTAVVAIYAPSRPIIYLELLTPGILLVESRSCLLFKRLIAADSFNWSNCVTLILQTGK